MDLIVLFFLYPGNIFKKDLIKLFFNYMSKKIIYYYQTFVGLDDILNNINSKVTHIHLSSFHFGTDINNNPYLHLNDFKPDNSKYK